MAQLATIDPARISLVQLCDAPLLAPTDEQTQRAESRNRLLPGEGDLPLKELVSGLASGVPKPPLTRSHTSMSEAWSSMK